MARGPSPTYPAVEATPEFVEWFRSHVSQLLPKAAEIVKTGEQHVPVFFVYPAEKDVMPAIVPVPQFFHGIHGKDVASLLHREMANDDMVHAVILLNEAWVKLALRFGPDSPPLSEVMKRGIHDDPDRQEAIVFNAQRRGMQLMATYLIKRPENELQTPPAIILDPAKGIIEQNGEPSNEGAIASFGRMIVPPKEGA